MNAKENPITAKDYISELSIKDKEFYNAIFGHYSFIRLADYFEEYASLKSKEDNRELVEMLKSAKCPDCDGSGTIVNEVTRTGVRWVDDGHGNPIAEPEPIIDYEPSPCQWCYEKDKIIQKHTS